MTGKYQEQVSVDTNLYTNENFWRFFYNFILYQSFDFFQMFGQKSKSCGKNAENCRQIKTSKVDFWFVYKLVSKCFFCYLLQKHFTVLDSKNKQKKYLNSAKKWAFAKYYSSPTRANYQIFYAKLQKRISSKYRNFVRWEILFKYYGICNFAKSSKTARKRYRRLT